MTVTHSHRPYRRKLDAASLVLLLVGIGFGIFAYWLVTVHDLNPLVLAPSMIAATIGATHITKREAGRG